MKQISFSQPYTRTGNITSITSWKNDMADMLRKYLNGESIFVCFDTKYDPKREGSIGKLVINNVQDLLHGSYGWRARGPRDHIEEIPANVKADNFERVMIDGHVVWNGRSNKVQFSQWSVKWLPDRAEEEGTVWEFLKPESKPRVAALDKLGREIKIGDFISYILYHFDNNYNAAGLYYGKVTKIDRDGTVHAKNIKLKEDDAVDEKRIKDNSLIVIMSKDLMDKLMLARLSII